MTSCIYPLSTTSRKVLGSESGICGAVGGHGERRHIKTQVHMQARRHVARTNVRGQRPTTPLFKPGSCESYSLRRARHGKVLITQKRLRDEGDNPRGRQNLHV